MAYLGSTAASSVANPPTLLIPKIMGGIPATTQLSTANGTNVYQEQGGGVWRYVSSNASSDVIAANYFTDAQAIGMRPGDMLFIQQWTTLGSSFTLAITGVVSVSTSGAVVSTNTGYISST